MAGELDLMVSYLYDPHDEPPIHKINIGVSPQVRKALHRNDSEVWAIFIEQLVFCDEFEENEDILP